MAGLVTILHDLAKDSREQANAIVEEVQKGRNNVGKMCHDFVNDPETPHAFIKEFQAWDENAQKVRNEHLKVVQDRVKKDLITEAAMSDEVFAVKETEYDAHKETIKDALNMLAKRPDFKPEILADIPPLLSLTTGKELSESNGTGGKKPRLETITVNGAEAFTEKVNADKSVKRSFSFTSAAAFITADLKKKKAKGATVTASDLSEPAFADVGTDNLSDKVSISYTFTVTDDAKVTHSYDIVVVPAGNAKVAEPEAKPAK